MIELMAEAAEIIYCIDTSALIDLDRLYPKNTFPTLWEKLEELIRDKRLISSIKVLVELSARTDDIYVWAKKHKQMFKRQNSKRHIDIIKEILRKHPTLVDEKKEREDADPFLVALALTQKRIGPEDLFRKSEWVVITQEKPSRGSRVKIPDVCKYYGIKCTSIVEFLKMEQWKF